MRESQNAQERPFQGGKSSKGILIIDSIMQPNHYASVSGNVESFPTSKLTQYEMFKPGLFSRDKQ